MVRGPAALLAVLGAALAYVLVAPELPQLHPPELSALVASAIGLTFVVAIVAGLAAMADSPFTLFPAVLGAGLLVAALDANDIGVAATPFEVVLLCCLGIAFAVVFDVPALAVALPLFLGAIDVVQAVGGGSAGLFTLSTTKPGDVLTLDLPDWGTGLAAARLSATDVIFLGAFAVIFDTPALAVALPLFLAAIDIAQAHGGGSAGLFTLSTSKPGDALTLELPDWGTGLAAARLSAPDVVFLGAFAAYARRLGLRERAAEAGMLVGLLVAVASEVLFDAELPTIALMAAGYLATNVDRLGGLFARAADE